MSVWVGVVDVGCLGGAESVNDSVGFEGIGVAGLKLL